MFLGNCQLASLSASYNRYVAHYTGTRSSYVTSYGDHLSDTDRQTLEDANILIRQIADFRSITDDLNLKTGTMTYPVPVVTGSFLWPYGGKPHPRNAPSTFHKRGPYHSQLGDSWLNRRMDTGEDPERVVDEYMQLDISQRLNLDRLLKISLDKQRRLDGQTGYAVADLIEASFQDQQFFYDAYHPHQILMRHLALRLFQHMDVDNAIQLRAERLLIRTNIPDDALPIHPSVWRHYGLRYVNEATRYQFMSEGSFTFREWMLRYMRYEWSEAFEEGVHLLNYNGDTDRALARVRDGLNRQPQSPRGLSMLAQLQLRKGAGETALGNMEEAVRLEPAQPQLHVLLGHIRSHNKDFEGAAASFRRAIGLDPGDASFYHHLAHTLLHLKQADEGILAMRKGIDIDPSKPTYFAVLGLLLDMANLPDAALKAYEAAIALRPDDIKLRIQQSHLLAGRGRLAEAIIHVEAALTIQPDSVQLLQHLAHLYAQTDRLENAQRVIARAIELAPTAKLYNLLAHTLGRLGDKEGALEAGGKAAALEPGNHSYHSLHGHLLIAVDRIEEAEQAFRRAIALAPADPAFHSMLGHLLGRLQRSQEAADAFGQALTLAPENERFKKDFDVYRRIVANEKQAPSTLAFL